MDLVFERGNPLYFPLIQQANLFSQAFLKMSSTEVDSDSNFVSQVAVVEDAVVLRDNTEFGVGMFVGKELSGARQGSRA